jgi:cyanophycinase
MGYLVLEGGAEFGGAMQRPDRHAIGLAGGASCRVRIVPAAAAPDQNHVRAGNNGVAWFRSLGVRDVRSVPLIDPDSAADPDLARTLSEGALIYLLGGFPGYLAGVLDRSLAWKAMMAVEARGGVLAGSSAGAMVLCEHFYDPAQKRVRNGLGLVSGACIVPHHDTFGHQWVPVLQELLPAATLIGIDEQTGLIGSRESDRWVVRGKGGVTLYRNAGRCDYAEWDEVRLTGGRDPMSS